jgi:hypothetical protein
MARRTARAIIAPMGAMGPAYSNEGPRSVLATTTASVPVQLASPPCGARTPASASARAFASVAVITVLTRAAWVSRASTTSMMLIVPARRCMASVTPAAHRMAQTHGNDGRYGGPGAFFNRDLRLIESGRGHQAHEWLDDAPRPRQCRQIRTGCTAVVILVEMHVHDVPRAG